jgi:molecular chaperone GrpE (heat shock protein)
MPDNDPLHTLGRSVAQVHIKLSRIEAKIAGGAGTPRPSGSELGVLLDLLDAVESAIDRRPESRRWFRRPRALADDLWRGLAVAAAEAREQLHRSGIEPAPVEGAFDAALHCVVDVVPTRAGNAEGTLAATHRRGWVRRNGSERVVLRTAQVSVHG